MGSTVQSLFEVAFLFISTLLKFRQSRKQIMVFSILPKKRTKLTILSKEEAQDSEFRLFFGELRTPLIAFEIY